MAQNQHKTITIRLEHATAEQFYGVFNPPYPHLSDICSEIGIEIKIATDYFHATITVSCTGEIRKIEVEVISIEPPKKTTTYRERLANMLCSEHEIKLEVTDDGIVKWTVSCNHCPPPDDCLKLLESVSKAVDNYFGQN